MEGGEGKREGGRGGYISSVYLTACPHRGRGGCAIRPMQIPPILITTLCLLVILLSLDTVLAMSTRKRNQKFNSGCQRVRFRLLEEPPHTLTGFRGADLRQEKQ